MTLDSAFELLPQFPSTATFAEQHDHSSQALTEHSELAPDNGSQSIDIQLQH
jgi:hypothetical protein